MKNPKAAEILSIEKKNCPAKSVKNSIMIARSMWGKATLGLSVGLNQIHLSVDHD